MSKKGGGWANGQGEWGGKGCYVGVKLKRSGQNF